MRKLEAAKSTEAFLNQAWIVTGAVQYAGTEISEKSVVVGVSDLHVARAIA